MNPMLHKLFASYSDVLSVEDVAELVDGTSDEVLCFLTGRSLPGVSVGGQWFVLKEDLVTFFVSGPSPAGMILIAERQEPTAGLLPAAACACWPLMCCDSDWLPSVVCERPTPLHPER